jgi:uncharacterized protein YkwD
MSGRTRWVPAGLLVLGLVGFSSSLGARGEEDEAKLTTVESAIIRLTNAERKKAELEPLRASKMLTEAARGHARNMARQRKMSHELDGKRMSDRITATGYRWTTCGENVAHNQRSPQQVVRAWMKSPPHRKNILSPKYTEIGVGMGRDLLGRPYFCQVFARPREAPAPAGVE